MFFEQAVFKRLLKEAYKARSLTIGKTEEADNLGEINREGLYLSGGWWEMWIDLEAMPKAAKAVIIELAGEFPKKGEFFTVTKDGNQYEIEREQYYSLLHRAKEAKTQSRITKIMFSKKTSSIRLLQNENGSIALINDICTRLVDNESIMNQIDEMTPLGPLSAGHGDIELYWWNYYCAFGVMPIGTREDDQEELALLGLLENMELPGWT